MAGTMHGPGLSFGAVLLLDLQRHEVGEEKHEGFYLSRSLRESKLWWVWGELGVMGWCVWEEMKALGWKKWAVHEE